PSPAPPRSADRRRALVALEPPSCRPRRGRDRSTSSRAHTNPAGRLVAGLEAVVTLRRLQGHVAVVDVSLYPLPAAFGYGPEACTARQRDLDERAGRQVHGLEWRPHTIDSEIAKDRRLAAKDAWRRETHVVGADGYGGFAQRPESDHLTQPSAVAARSCGVRPELLLLDEDRRTALEDLDWRNRAVARVADRGQPVLVGPTS